VIGQELELKEHQHRNRAYH
jgi:hypothetical protein